MSVYTCVGGYFDKTSTCISWLNFRYNTALQDEDERVRGWFPRRCVKIPDHRSYHHHGEAGDHTSQSVINEHDQEAKPENNLKVQDVCVKPKPTSSSVSQAKEGSLKRSRDKSKTSHTREGVASGTTPTAGARKRVKKDKKKENKS